MPSARLSDFVDKFISVGRRSMINQFVWDTYIELGANAFSTGNYEVAEAMIRAAVKEARRTEQPYGSVAAAVENLGEVFKNQGRYEKAERLYKRALSMHEGRLGSSSAHSCRILFKMAELSLLREKTSAAERYYERAFKIAEKCSLDDLRHVIDFPLRLAGLWNERGRHQDAVQAYNHVRLLRQKLAACG